MATTSSSSESRICILKSIVDYKNGQSTFYSSISRIKISRFVGHRRLDLLACSDQHLDSATLSASASRSPTRRAPYGAKLSTLALGLRDSLDCCPITYTVRPCLKAGADGTVAATPLATTPVLQVATGTPSPQAT
jgi:hypothetical protein